MPNRPFSFTKLFKTLGPGLLYAGAAIGVSHLVQSTQAGAKFGFAMIWVVILINVVKYPFFEFGPRYAAATGESLLEGYHKTGRWALGLFLVLTLATMFTVQAAVTIVTAGLAVQLTGIELSPAAWSAILLFICLIILGFGRYSILDNLMKVIIIVLTLTTLVALFSAIWAYESGDFPKQADLMQSFDWTEGAHIFFLVTLIGWMPAPIDIAIWHSVWTLAKKEDSGYTPSLKESLVDFKIGYWGTTILAVAFVSLGTLVIYGSGTILSPKGAEFAGQLIEMYTFSLGSWAWFIIAIAAFTTMFSTTLTCLDAFPRVMRRATGLLVPAMRDKKWERKLYWAWILFTAAGALVVLVFFSKNMKNMVDVATTLSFLTAPILAFVNLWVVTGKNMPKESRPGPFLKAFSYFGLVFLTGFALFYLWTHYNS